MSVAVADFDRDGNLDLAVTSYVESNVGGYRGRGDGSFEERVIYGALGVRKGVAGILAPAPARRATKVLPDKVILDRSGKSENTIISIALDATNLYFTEIGFNDKYGLAKMPLDVASGHIYFNVELSSQAVGIQAVSLDAQAGPILDGGTTPSDGVVTLVTTGDSLGEPVFAGGNLYYGSGGKLMGLPAQGGVATVIATPPNGFYSPIVGTSGDQLYWDTGRQTCSDIVRSGLDGSGQRTLVHSLERPSRFALNSTHLFILTASNQSQILRVPR